MASAAQHQISSHERECVIFRANTLSALNEIKALMSRGTATFIRCVATLILTMLGLIGYLAHIVYAPH